MIFKWLIYFISTSNARFKRYFLLNKKFNNSNISIEANVGDEVVLKENVSISQLVIVRGQVELGKGTFVNGPSRIVAPLGSEIKIGPFCSIAAYTCIFSGNHPLNKVSTYQSSNGFYKETFSDNSGIVKSIYIGADVWIGTHAVVLSGVKIGNGAVVAAGSVVTKDVPPFAVVAGVPAKVVSFRFEQGKIDFLNDLAWWEWSDDKIKRNKAFFQHDVEKTALPILREKVV